MTVQHPNKEKNQVQIYEPGARKSGLLWAYKFGVFSINIVFKSMRAFKITWEWGRREWKRKKS